LPKFAQDRFHIIERFFSRKGARAAGDERSNAPDPRRNTLQPNTMPQPAEIANGAN
jgi:hypothetical protein